MPATPRYRCTGRSASPSWPTAARAWRILSATLLDELRQGSEKHVRQAYYVMLLKVGRWLAQLHPEATSPDLWTRELAADYVALVLKLTVGQWAHAERLRPSRVGKPLSSKARAHHLAAASAFFRDAQE